MTRQRIRTYYIGGVMLRYLPASMSYKYVIIFIDSPAFLSGEANWVRHFSDFLLTQLQFTKFLFLRN